MTGNEYQLAAMRSSSVNGPYELIHAGALGLCGESGEVADHVKKYLFQGHDLDKDHIAEELGDVLWYVATTAQGIGYGLDTIMQMNVDKLLERYPDGFESARSIYR